MGASKISDEELRESLDAGLAIKQIAEKHGMAVSSVYVRMHRMRMKAKSENPGRESALDCFAYDCFNGNCSCLDVKKCPGKPCPFYKEAGQALKEAKRENDPCGVYRRNTLEVIAMIERNQGIRA